MTGRRTETSDTVNVKVTAMRRKIKNGTESGGRRAVTETEKKIRRKRNGKRWVWFPAHFFPGACII